MKLVLRICLSGRAPLKIRAWSNGVILRTANCVNGCALRTRTRVRVWTCTGYSPQWAKSKKADLCPETTTPPHQGNLAGSKRAQISSRFCMEALFLLQARAFFFWGTHAPGWTPKPHASKRVIPCSSVPFWLRPACPTKMLLRLWPIEKADVWGIADAVFSFSLFNNTL